MLVESMGNTGCHEQAMEGKVGAKGEIESAEGGYASLKRYVLSLEWKAE